MLIKTFSKVEAIEYIPKSKRSVMISITDPNEKEPEFKGQWKDILRIKFHDIDPLAYLKFNKPPEYWINWDTIIKYPIFDNGHAEKIFEFLDRNMQHRLDLIAIHCHAGVSRSVGVKIGLERIFSKEDSSNLLTNICYNKLVSAVLVDYYHNQGTIERNTKNLLTNNIIF